MTYPNPTDTVTQPDGTVVLPGDIFAVTSGNGTGASTLPTRTRPVIDEILKERVKTNNPWVDFATGFLGELFSGLSSLSELADKIVAVLTGGVIGGPIAGESWVATLSDFVGGFSGTLGGLQDFVQQVIDNIMNGLGFAGSGFSLGSLLSSLEAMFSGVFSDGGLDASKLIGDLPSTIVDGLKLLLGALSGGLLGNVELGQLIRPALGQERNWLQSFDSPESVPSGEGFEHDATVGRTAPGSAKVTFDGVEHVRMSDPIEAAAGQVLDLGGYVRFDGYAGSGGPAVALRVLAYSAGDQLLGSQLIGQVTPSGATSADFETVMQTTWTAPANTAYVYVRMEALAAGTAGTAHFDDLWLRKPAQSMPQQWIENLIPDLGNLGQGVTDAWNFVQSTIDNFMNGRGILGSLFSLSHFQDEVAKVFGPGSSIPQGNIDGLAGTLAQLLPGADFQSLLNKLSGVLGGAASGQTINGLAALFGSIPQGNVNGLTSALANVNAYVQDLVNAILRAIRGIPVVGGSLADIVAEIGGLNTKAVTAQETAQQTAQGVVDGWTGAGTSTGDVYDTMQAIKTAIEAEKVVITITSSTTFTKPTDIDPSEPVTIIGIGSGQNGTAGAYDSGASVARPGTPGIGGGYLSMDFPESLIPSSVSCTIGTNGGNVSFGSLLVTNPAVSSMAVGLAGFAPSASKPGDGGAGGGGAVQSVPGAAEAGKAGGTTPLAAGGTAGSAGFTTTPAGNGGDGAPASTTLPTKCGGAGGGGGGGANGNSGSARNSGKGGNGGFPGGAGGAAGGPNDGGTSGAGGIGASGVIFVIYKKKVA